jgi:hypothetical protein
MTAMHAICDWCFVTVKLQLVIADKSVRSIHL